MCSASIPTLLKVMPQSIENFDHGNGIILGTANRRHDIINVTL